MKKLIMLLLVSVALIPAFAGGNQNSSSRGAAGGSVKKYSGLPLVTNGTTLTMYVRPGDGNLVTSFDAADNVFTRKIIKDTGINLDIITSTQGTQQLSVLLNAGNYPEVIIADIGFDDLQYYAGQGIFLPLDGYDPLGYPNIKAAFDEYPFLSLVCRGGDGKLYALPQVNDNPASQYGDGRIWYHMPWMRDNNIKVPTTLDEFTEYLRFVKTHDLNKNGKQDEIPIAFSSGDTGNFIGFIAHAFLPYVAGQGGMAVVNGKVIEQYRDPAFREALKYMAGLYREGLILGDSFTMTGDQMRNLAESPDPVLAVQGPTWWNSYINHVTLRATELWTLPPLQGPTGQRYAGNTAPWTVGGPMYFITDKCKDPALAIALYNYFVDFENQMDGYIGPKGEAWDVGTPGVLSYLGTQAITKMKWVFGSQPVNASWAQANPMIRNQQFRFGGEANGIEIVKRWFETGDPSIQDQVLASDAYRQEAKGLIESTMLAKYDLPASLFIPPAALNDIDNARVADINAALNPYKSQAFVEFITGIRNINSDNDWNTYLADLNRLGSAELAQIRQKYLK